MAPSEDDPQPLTEADHAERDHLLKASTPPWNLACLPWRSP